MHNLNEDDGFSLRLTVQGVSACGGSPCSVSRVKGIQLKRDLQVGYRFRAAIAGHTSVSRYELKPPKEWEVLSLHTTFEEHNPKQIQDSYSY